LVEREERASLVLRVVRDGHGVTLLVARNRTEETLAFRTGAALDDRNGGRVSLRAGEVRRIPLGLDASEARLGALFHFVEQPERPSEPKAWGGRALIEEKGIVLGGGFDLGRGVQYVTPFVGIASSRLDLSVPYGEPPVGAVNLPASETPTTVNTTSLTVPVGLHFDTTLLPFNEDREGYIGLSLSARAGYAFAFDTGTWAKGETPYDPALGAGPGVTLGGPFAYLSLGFRIRAARFR
jgi:hypothetical protein